MRVSVFSHYTSGMSLLSGDDRTVHWIVRHSGVERPFSSFTNVIALNASLISLYYYD